MAKFLQNKKSSFIRFIKENGLSVNLLLLLGISAYIIIGIDLESELAVQKEEISSVVATLTNSLNTLSFDSADILIVEPPELGVIQTLNINPVTTHVTDFPKGRSPPVLLSSTVV